MRTIESESDSEARRKVIVFNDRIAVQCRIMTSAAGVNQDDIADVASQEQRAEVELILGAERHSMNGGTKAGLNFSGFESCRVFER